MQLFKKAFWTGYVMTTLVISNKEMDDIVKIIKSLQESGLFTKSVSESIENETKEPKNIFWHVAVPVY